MAATESCTLAPSGLRLGDRGFVRAVFGILRTTEGRVLTDRSERVFLSEDGSSWRRGVVRR
jgi:hypothetical protein